ncbi:MAG TPA: hypothetical protein VMB34_33860 [Acetobacteraceae bacterium]|nr:hypothetical protein [Acetobacteraceae bacterium]
MLGVRKDQFIARYNVEMGKLLGQERPELASVGDLQQFRRDDKCEAPAWRECLRGGGNEGHPDVGQLVRPQTQGLHDSHGAAACGFRE